MRPVTAPRCRSSGHGNGRSGSVIASARPPPVPPTASSSRHWSSRRGGCSWRGGTSCSSSPSRSGSSGAGRGVTVSSPEHWKWR
jgi:hypothetical protein